MDRRSDNGIWTIEHTKCDTGCNADQLNAGVGINYDDKLWLWFFVRRPGDHTNIWWKCPWQIIEILAEHMKERRRRTRRGELVREIGSQLADNVDDDMNALVREIQDHATNKNETVCWMCGDKPFNGKHQLRDHIEGAGEGGKHIGRCESAGSKPTNRCANSG